jgi:hypothetical protein
VKREVTKYNLAKCEEVICRLTNYEVAVCYLLKREVTTHNQAKCEVVMCRLVKYEVAV